MAMSINRLTPCGHESSLGEPEKDANALLSDLDKGLRSSKVGEQCEAIVRFPGLFEKYPFPILINSAFLKLADVFRTGNNFLRLCILKVTRQCDKHLDKITNVDEFIRRIFSVIHSNDAVARAITLRTLGNMAGIIPEKKNVHHSIICGLDSHDSVELEAAIFAANCFSAHSKSFATGICHKLAKKIEGLETPVEMKLKFIPIFQHMYYDAQTSATVRDLCTELLPNNPSSSFVLVTLHTLSQLSAKSLIDIPKQVELLLKYLETDPRRAIKVLALQDLKMLAKRGPHMWLHDNVQSLCQFTTTTPYDGLKVGALDVLTTLSKTLAVSQFEPSEGSPVLEIFCQCNYHQNTRISSKAAELLADLAIHSVRAEKSNAAMLCQESCNVLDTVIVVTSSDPSPSSMEPLKVCLRSAVQLCSVCPALGPMLITTIAGELTTTSEEKAVLLAESLAAIGSHQKGTLCNCMGDVLSLLDRLNPSEDQQKQTLGVLLCTLILQAYTNKSLPNNISEKMRNFLRQANAWIQYKIARQAMRYGHHQTSSHLWQTISTMVSTEHFFFWLGALHKMSAGESCLQQLKSSTAKSPVTIITAATEEYYKGISNLKAANTPMYPMSFQTEYMRLRVEMLHAHIQLIKVSTSFYTNPPPAIATSLAATTGQELHKCARGAGQLQRCADLFTNLVSQYTVLYQTSFDADKASLNNIQLLQQSCQLMVFLIETVLNKKSSLDVPEQYITKPTYGLTVDQKGLTESYQQLLAELQHICGKANKTPGLITFKHIDFLRKTSVTILGIPLCLPRYLFQGLQKTVIKLAISPQPKTSNDPVLVQNDTQLTVKVEGVIQHGSKPGLHRKIKAIKLGVNSVLQSRAQPPEQGKMFDNPPNSMYQTTEPHNDYFSTQFLLSFPVLGLHVINIEAAVIDEDGSFWRTGPRSTLYVKSYEDAIQRANLARQQSRAGTSS